MIIFAKDTDTPLFAPMAERSWEYPTETGGHWPKPLPPSPRTCRFGVDASLWNEQVDPIGGVRIAVIVGKDRKHVEVGSLVVERQHICRKLHQP